VARIAVAVSLALAIILMIVADIAQPDYDPSPAVITILGAIVLTLLGLEAHDLITGGTK
jgi:uncharacterized membrane protein